MQRQAEKPLKPVRLWVASIIVIVLVVAVWKFIDYRMRPPPPPPLPQDAATPAEVTGSGD